MTDDYRKIEERKGAGRKGEIMRKTGIYCRVKEEGTQGRNEKWRRKRGMAGVCTKRTNRMSWRRGGLICEGRDD